MINWSRVIAIDIAAGCVALFVTLARSNQDELEQAHASRKALEPSPARRAAAARRESDTRAEACKPERPLYFSGTRLARLEVSYGSDLRELKESPLCPRADRQVYRFTWLRSFHPAVVVRMERVGHEYALILKTADRVAREWLTKVPSELRVTPTSAQWEHFTRLLEEARFADPPAPDPIEGDLKDGARWILEAAGPGYYHVVSRHSPAFENRFPQFRDACWYLVELAGLKVEPEQVY